ncbi:hydrolase [Luteolibacter sp. Populi]|uniref:hydrolase n=1 Tax=Luteolibacter sp. Populi TaxID=3230487 RepID=UPI0034655621
MSTIIYVDVDDTLIRTVGTRRIPIPAVIEHVRRLKSDGAELYLWSAGGAAYCEEIAEELGIRDCFVAFLPKPRIIIDDQEVRDWVFCTTFHPSTCTGRTLADYFRI